MSRINFLRPTEPDPFQIQQLRSPTAKNSSTNAVNTNAVEIPKENAVIAETVSEISHPENVSESKRVSQDSKLVIVPVHPSTYVDSNTSVAIRTNNAMKISPDHDYEGRLQLPKAFAMGRNDFSVLQAGVAGQTDNPDVLLPLITKSDADEDFNLRPSTPIQHSVNFIPKHKTALAVNTMSSMENISIFDRDPLSAFIVVTSIGMKDIATYLHFWPPPQVIADLPGLRPVRREASVVNHHASATVETYSSPVHRHRLRHRGRPPGLRCNAFVVRN